MLRRLSPEDHAYLSTTPIWDANSDNVLGTGFFYRIENDPPKVYLVSAKHVFEEGDFHFCIRHNVDPIIRRLQVPRDRLRVPRRVEVDLAAVDVTDILSPAVNEGTLRSSFIDFKMIATNDVLENTLTAVVPVMMFGYPTGPLGIQ